MFFTVGKCKVQLKVSLHLIEMVTTITISKKQINKTKTNNNNNNNHYKPDSTALFLHRWNSIL